MAITDLASAVRLPAFYVTNLAFNYSGSFYLNGSSTTKLAFIFQAPVAGNLEYAEYYIGYAAGAAAVKVSFQDVDASGLPDGTADAYKVIASPTTGWISQQLTATGAGGGALKAVTQGQWVALVVEWDSTQSGYYEWHGLGNESNTAMVGSTYPLKYSGSWSRNPGNTNYPNFALKYDDGAYYPITGPVVPCTTTFSVAYNTGTGPDDEIGLRLQCGAGVRVTGAWLLCAFVGPGDVVLYDSDGTTVLTSKAIDPDVMTGTARTYYEVQFPTSVTLDASTPYRVTLKPTSGSNVTLYGVVVASAAVLDAHPCGADWHTTSRADAGAWTDTTTSRPFLGLIIDGVEAAGGGGGASGSSYTFVG